MNSSLKVKMTSITFISAAVLSWEGIFIIKIILENVNNKNGTNQIVNKCEKNLNPLGRKFTKNSNNHFLREQYFNLKRRY